MSSSSDMQNFPSTKNQRILFLIKKNHMRDASEQEFYCTLWPRLQNPFFHCLKQHKESANDVMSNYHPTSIYFLPPQLCIRQSEKKKLFLKIFLRTGICLYDPTWSHKNFPFLSLTLGSLLQIKPSSKT